MGKFTVDKKLLPVKAQYFLWNAGTAPIVPFLPTYARQLGFSSVIVGTIYTIMPVAGMIAKPIFGAIADRTRKQKMMFILFQFITALAFFNIQFLPEIPTETHTQLDCKGSDTFFAVCGEKGGDTCAVEQILAQTDSVGTVHCRANCKVTDESFWNELCTSWHVQEYCTSKIKTPNTLRFTAKVPTGHILQVKDCTYLRVGQAVFADGKEHVPYCNRFASSSCNVRCSNAALTKLLGERSLGEITCESETNLKICGKDETLAQEAIDGLGKGNIDCEVECPDSNAALLSEVCSKWKVPLYCPGRADSNNSLLNDNLEFNLDVPLNGTQQRDECTYFRVASATFFDDTPHTPYCVDASRNECQMTCDNALVNDLIKGQATNTIPATSLYQFWLFFALMLLSWCGMAVVVSVGDAICFEMLGPNPSQYGRQRLWGSVGWGIFSLIAGFLVDAFSKGNLVKDYTPVFYLMLVMIVLDMIVSSRLRYEQSKMSTSIARDIGRLLGDIRIVVFLLWCIFVGLCTGMVWNFLFWHLEDLASAEGCDAYKWIKTLEGLVMGIQTFGGELPFFFISGWVINKIGHVHAMSLVLFAFGVRFVLYSLLVNPWWCLPIELLQGVTFGIFYSTMASYASIVAPRGTEATVQGLVGAVFEGIGVSLGSFTGGILFKVSSGSAAYLYYGIAAFIMFLLHVIVQFFLQRRKLPEEEPQAVVYNSDEEVHMLDS